MNTATIASPTLSAAANSGLGTVKADTAAVPAAPAFHVRYASLFCPGRALAFPCDAAGWVDLQALPGHARDNYLIARALVGQDYSEQLVCGPIAPAVQGARVM